MKFQLAVNLERMDPSTDMNAVARHTLEIDSELKFHNLTSLAHHKRVAHRL